MHAMESLYPEKMNKGGVLGEYINKSSSASALTTAAEEAVMAELAQEFAPFDLDLITSGAKARAQQELGASAAGTVAAPEAGKQEGSTTRPTTSLQTRE